MKTIVIISPVKNIEHVRKTFQNMENNTGIQLKFIGLEKGIEGVATYFDKTLIAPEILRLAYLAEQNNADAIIINCSSEPGLAAAKELLSIPVIGIFEVTLQSIARIKKPFSILLPKFHANYLHILQEIIKQHGLEHLLASFYEINLEYTPEQQLNSIKNALNDAIYTNQTQTIILSSTYLAKYQDECQKIISASKNGVSIIIPLLEALNFVDGIFNKTQIYDRANLLPPKTEKIKQWLSQINS